MPALSHSPAQVVQYHLISLALGSNPTGVGDWKVYRDKEPSGDRDPDEVITVYDTSPVLDGKDMRTREAIKHPGIQIRIRALTTDAGKAKGREIEAALEATLRATVVVPPKTYILQGFKVTTGLTPFGQEDEKKKRVLYSINGTITLYENP